MAFIVAALDRLTLKLAQKALVRLSSQATGKVGLWGWALSAAGVLGERTAKSKAR